jgi:hypothetical protein
MPDSPVQMGREWQDGEPHHQRVGSIDAFEKLE